MLAEERGVAALAKVQVLAPGLAVGVLNGFVGTVIQSHLRSSSQRLKSFLKRVEILTLYAIRQSPISL